MQSSHSTPAIKSNPVATNLISEDHMKKLLTMTTGKQWKFHDNKLLPKSQHSAFGNFPKEYMKKDLHQSSVMTVTPLPKTDKLELSIAVTPLKTPLKAANIKKGGGTGGQCFSLQTPKPKPKNLIPKAGAVAPRPIMPSEFRRFYDRGDLPISVEHHSRNRIAWKVDKLQLDYHHYLPIFFEGIREKQEPYRFLAIQGCLDLLSDGGGSKVLPVIPQLIIPIKTALNTRDPEIICITLKILQELVQSSDTIGEALVPYYRQILPVFNLFKNSNLNLGDKIQYSQRKGLVLGDLITQTLEVFEMHGGEDAFINIKYMVPTYESCIL